MQEQELNTEISGVIAGNVYEKITKAQELDNAGIYLKFVKAKYKEIEAARLAITRPLDESKKRTMEMFAPYLERLKGLEKQVIEAMGTYQQEVEAINQARLEAARAEAQAEAEKQRKANEARAKTLEDAGLSEAAEVARTAEVALDIEPVHQFKTKATGVTQRINWKYEIIDAEAVPRSYLMVDEAKVGLAVRSQKGEIAIPGVRVYSEVSMY